MPHVDELGGHDRDEACTTTIGLHKAQHMGQREIDAGSSIEVGQLGTDTSKDNGSHAGDDNEMTNMDQVEQVESSRADISRSERREGRLNTGEAVVVDHSHIPDKQVNCLPGIQVEGEMTAGKSEDTDEAGGNVDKSVDIRLMVNRSRAEGDRTEGKRDPPHNNTSYHKRLMTVESRGLPDVLWHVSFYTSEYIGFLLGFSRSSAWLATNDSSIRRTGVTTGKQPTHNWYDASTFLS
ncbi:hypothetical protein K435DRAFT_868603 [Dendrothele bispora CBS 962.96]|uniref:Uncharacterized protein n=1 Tax=Dendrothele bispora (strain CBS 962.96) TaxID=1314807 RepID=A0A4S8LBQ6_DENBC|nr:hypothetical protein K435DRAFT_868603 [Dendrothele bispora CBS 962.96]